MFQFITRSIYECSIFNFDEQYVPCLVSWLICLLRDIAGSCSWSWMKTEVYIRNVDTRNELLGRIIDAVARINESQDELKRVAKCIGVAGGSSEYLLYTGRNVLFRQ